MEDTLAAIGGAALGPNLLWVTDWGRAEQWVMPLRIAVFVVEQGVPAEIERDAFDPLSLHAVATGTDGQVVGTGRLLPDGHIGRMAVAASQRGSGLGGRILELLVDEARSRGFPEVVLNAQVRAEAFYRKHGFEAEGEVFMEAGIEHRTMRRRLA